MVENLNSAIDNWFKKNDPHVQFISLLIIVELLFSCYAYIHIYFVCCLLILRLWRGEQLNIIIFTFRVDKVVNWSWKCSSVCRGKSPPYFYIFCNCFCLNQQPTELVLFMVIWCAHRSIRQRMLMSTNSVFYNIRLILGRDSLGLTDAMGGIAGAEEELIRAYICFLLLRLKLIKRLEHYVER